MNYLYSQGRFDFLVRQNHIMAPGLSKKGQTILPNSKATTSRLSRRTSILDEPVTKTNGFMSSTSQLQVSGNHSSTPTTLPPVNNMPPISPVHEKNSPIVSPIHKETTFHEPSDASVEVNAGGVNTGRGPTCGLGLHKRNRRLDKNMSVTIDPDFGRALTRTKSSSFANELGQIALAYVWPISLISSREAILPLILLRLEVKLEIQNITDPSVQDKIWLHFLRLVKGRRG
ncbi:hypothetical protein LINPERHAP2_LOCUS41429 [Linum perenne]